MPVWFMNLMITFLVSGLWHGANWTFVAWGGLHGAYLVTPLLLTKGLGIRFKWFPNNFLIRFVKIIFVFILVDLAWIFFRANSITDAFMIYEKIFATPYNFPTLDNMRLHLFGNLELVLGISMIFILLGFEFLIRRKGLDHFYQRLPEMGRFGVYFAFLFSIIFLGHYSSKIEFIYFQF
jgi:D-alanyl-lipoteichoic acid acyltransferase DltB (MBOAT superfamily)